MKRSIFAVIAIFIVWTLLDVVIHGVLLKSTYEATAELWRAPEEMKMPLMHIVTLGLATCFVTIYAKLVSNKSLCRGLLFGALYGLAAGIPMGFASYCVMPIPLSLAYSWCLGAFTKITIAGLIIGVTFKKQPLYNF